MTNTFQTIIGKLEKGNNLEFVGEIFSNEILLDESPQCSILGEITFFDVEFRKVDFTGSNFVGCKFKNCRLKDIIFRKCEFWNSTFENCQIEKFSNFEKILKDLDLISNDQIQNYDELSSEAN